MGDTTRDTLDQTDEDILTPTVSDEALEAATNRDQTDEDILTYSDEALGRGRHREQSD